MGLGGPTGGRRARRSSTAGRTLIAVLDTGGVEALVPRDARSRARLRALRAQVLEAIEPMRREKVAGSGLEAEVAVPASAALSLQPEALAELFITAKVRLADGESVEVSRTDDHKCGRCWRHIPEVTEDGALCGRCDEVLNG